MRTLQLYDQNGEKLGLYNTLIQDDDTIDKIIEGIIEYITQVFERGDDIDERETFDKLLLKNGIERIYSEDFNTEFNDS